MATDNKQPKLTKRQKTMVGKVDSTKLYPIDNALALVKSAATAKFDESIDVAVQLGIDAKKSDQVVRGAVVMPSAVVGDAVGQSISPESARRAASIPSSSNVSSRSVIGRLLRRRRAPRGAGRGRARSAT